MIRTERPHQSNESSGRNEVQNLASGNEMDRELDNNAVREDGAQAVFYTSYRLETERNCEVGFWRGKGERPHMG